MDSEGPEFQEQPVGAPVSARYPAFTPPAARVVPVAQGKGGRPAPLHLDPAPQRTMGEGITGIGEADVPRRLPFSRDVQRGQDLCLDLRAQVNDRGEHGSHRPSRPSWSIVRSHRCIDKGRWTLCRPSTPQAGRRPRGCTPSARSSCRGQPLPGNGDQALPARAEHVPGVADNSGGYLAQLDVLAL